MGDWPTAPQPAMKCVERGRKKRPEIKSKSFQNESSEQTKFRGKWLWCADICQDGHKLALIATASFCPAPNHLYWGRRCFVLNLSRSPWMNVNMSNCGFKAKPSMYMTQCLNIVFVFICICLYLYLHSHLNLYLFCVQVGHLLCLANARSHASHLIHVWR